MRYIDVTGKTEAEAIEKALSQLGLERDDVSVEILERAKSGFFGIGSSPAKVRVTYDNAAQEDVLEEIEQLVEPAPPAENPQPVEEPKAERPRGEKKPQEKREKRPQEKRESQNRPEKKAEKPAPAPAAPVELGEEVNDEKAQQIRTFLTGLLEHMDSAATIKIYLPENDRYKVYLEGEKMGQLIGRRGETLDAIQQLTNYAVNRDRDKRVRIHVDAENYREKREQSLEHLARKVAAKVVKYRKSVTLEPMNAYERHVIHTALQDVEHVTTFSTGTEPNRRVVVSYEK